jgi:excisionase family DNA binding protein
MPEPRERISTGKAARICDAITAPVAEFRLLSGLSRDTIYKLLKSGELRSIKIGRRRLIVIESYHALIRERGGGLPITLPTNNATMVSDVGRHSRTERNQNPKSGRALRNKPRAITTAFR